MGSHSDKAEKKMKKTKKSLSFLIGFISILCCVSSNNQDQFNDDDHVLETSNDEEHEGRVQSLVYGDKISTMENGKVLTLEQKRYARDLATDIDHDYDSDDYLANTESDEKVPDPENADVGNINQPPPRLARKVTGLLIKNGKKKG